MKAKTKQYLAALAALPVAGLALPQPATAAVRPAAAEAEARISPAAKAELAARAPKWHLPAFSTVSDDYCRGDWSQTSGFSDCWVQVTDPGEDWTNHWSQDGSFSNSWSQDPMYTGFDNSWGQVPGFSEGWGQAPSGGGGGWSQNTGLTKRSDSGPESYASILRSI